MARAKKPRWDEKDAVRRGRAAWRLAGQHPIRVETPVDAISSRGRLAFRSDPLVRERFAALVTSAGPAPDEAEPAPAAPPA
jgi:hypothetical protein